MASPTGSVEPDQVAPTIDLSDFSPGIFSDYLAGVPSNGSTVAGYMPVGNGAAVASGTYRCCADPTGALIPLPARVAGGYTATMPGTTTTPTYYPTNNKALYTTDAAVIGSVHNLSDPVGETLLLGQTWFYDASGTSSYSKFYRVRGYKSFTVGTFDPFFTKAISTSTPPASGIGGITFAFGRHNYTGTNYAQYLIIGVNNYEAGGLLMKNGGSIPAGEQTLTTFGTDTTNVWFYPDGTSSLYNYPAITGSPNNTLQVAITGLTPTSSLGGVDDVIGHQGRIVTSLRGFEKFHTNVYWNTDRIAYGAALDTLGVSPTTAIYGEENVSGIAFIASLSADEMLVMKNHGGGYAIRGDIGTPTVTRLGGLESPYGVKVHPATTPIGVVYATRNGIFAWAGGEYAQKLSNQIDGKFFDHVQDTTNEIFNGFKGRMAWWHPWVCVPNNWLYDTRNKAWWRLEDPTTNTSTPYSIYAVSPVNGSLYAVPYKTTATQTVLFDNYDPILPASSYQWTSQPIVESLDRVQAWTDLNLVLSAGSNTNTCTVTVTLSGFTADGVAVTPVSTSFTFTGDGTGKPDLQNKHILPQFVAQYVTVKIAASVSSGPAPKIHRLQIFSADRGRTPVGN